MTDMNITPNLGLKAWTASLDPYDSAQLSGNFAKLDQHDHTAGKGARITTAAIADRAVTQPKLAVGSIGGDVLSDATYAAFGGNTPSGTIRRGKSIITATTGTRTNTGYGALSDAADLVPNIYLPTDGLIFVAYQAMWKGVGGAPRAAIFLNAVNVTTAAEASISPVAQNAAISGTANYVPLASSASGLVSGNTSASDYTGDSATGQILGVAPSSSNGARFETAAAGFGLSPSAAGGPAVIMAAAGAYNVGIQFKCSAGTVSAQNRRLWVWTMDFS